MEVSVAAVVEEGSAAVVEVVDGACEVEGGVGSRVVDTVVVDVVVVNLVDEEAASVVVEASEGEVFSVVASARDVLDAGSSVDVDPSVDVDALKVVAGTTVVVVATVEGSSVDTPVHAGFGPASSHSDEPRRSLLLQPSSGLLQQRVAILTPTGQLAVHCERLYPPEVSPGSLQCHVGAGPVLVVDGALEAVAAVVVDEVAAVVVDEVTAAVVLVVSTLVVLPVVVRSLLHAGTLVPHLIGLIFSALLHPSSGLLQHRTLTNSPRKQSLVQ